MAQVLFDERRDEEIAVVVAAVPAQREALSGRRACRLEGFGMELLREEFVGQPLVDEDAAVERAFADERRGVPAIPGGRVGTEIAAERLLPPRALRRRADRRERPRRS